MNKSSKLWGSISAFAIVTSGSALAQDTITTEDERTLEKVTVTGSYIEGTPEDTALPVDVLTAGDLKLEGNPTITELIRNLGVSSGVDGQTNQFGSNGLEGTSNVNLRGLGPARTLVLLNGHRETFAPTSISEQAQLFVDTNVIPTAAISRVEVLKDGAAALYGSDAISGVVNFMTRDDFEGFEIGGEFQTYEGTDGEYNVSAIAGFDVLGGNWVTSVGYQFKSEVPLLEKDWAIVPFADNPVGGWSTIGNPGSFVATPNIAPGSAIAGTPLAFANSDDQCSLLGGTEGGVLCRFQFTQFDNLVEEEEKYQVFSEFNTTLGNGTNFHVEALYAHTDVPEWKTSPSYPPQSLFGQLVLPNHPGLQQYIADNPAWAGAVYTDFSPLLAGGAPVPAGLSTATTPLIFFGRSFGFGGFPGTGGAQEGKRSYDHYRLSGGFDGEFENGVNWDANLTYSETDASSYTNDTTIGGFSAALRGFGLCADRLTGAVPTGAVPGQDGCEYYNPFSNSIAASAIDGTVNPQYDPALANSPELANWLTVPFGSDRESTLLVFDGVINGDTGFDLSGGDVQFAAGLQIRRESFTVDVGDFSNLAINPGPSGNGVGSFLAGGNDFDASQTIYAVFTEFQLPVSDILDVQLAARYEDYGGGVGSTFDPKLAAKLQVADGLALRGSAQTSFRGPTLNQLSDGASTTLQFIAPTGAFKAVDTTGDPNINPESATSFNLGALWETSSGFSASLDYYNFDFEDPIIVEDQNAIVNAAVAAIGTGDLTSPILNRLTFQIPTAPSASGIERIGTNIVNGPNIKTSGVDLRMEQVFDGFLGGGSLSLAFDGTYILEYDVADFAIEGVTISGGDRVGQFNRSNFSRSLPQLKANATVNYNLNGHNLRGIVRHVDSYEDERGALAPNSEEIDAQTTFDLFYNFDWETYGTSFSAGVINVTDEDPPFAAFDLNYDPYTHNPFGRTFKVGITKTFGTSE